MTSFGIASNDNYDNISGLQNNKDPQKSRQLMKDHLYDSITTGQDRYEEQQAGPLGMDNNYDNITILKKSKKSRVNRTVANSNLNDSIPPVGETHQEVERSEPLTRGDNYDNVRALRSVGKSRPSTQVVRNNQCDRVSMDHETSERIQTFGISVSCDDYDNEASFQGVGKPVLCKQLVGYNLYDVISPVAQDSEKKWTFGSVSQCDNYDNTATLQDVKKSRPLRQLVGNNLYDVIPPVARDTEGQNSEDLQASSLSGGNDTYDNLSRDQFEPELPQDTSGFYAEVSSPYYKYKMNSKLQNNIRKLDSIVENMAELADAPVGWNEYHSGQFSESSRHRPAILKRSQTFPVNSGDVIYESIDDMFVNNTGTVRKSELLTETEKPKRYGQADNDRISFHTRIYPDDSMNTRSLGAVSVQKRSMSEDMDLNDDNVDKAQYSGKNVFFYSRECGNSDTIKPISLDTLKRMIHSIDNDTRSSPRIKSSQSLDNLVDHKVSESRSERDRGHTLFHSYDLSETSNAAGKYDITPNTSKWKSGFVTDRDGEQSKVSSKRSFASSTESDQVASGASSAMTLDPQHVFESRVLRRSRGCDICQLAIINTGQYCTVCKFICHRKCQSQVMTQCVTPVNFDTSRRHDAVKSPPVSIVTSSTSPTKGLTQGKMSTLRSKMARAREESSPDMDLTYITERIIVLSFEAEGNEALYRSSLQEVARMLANKHAQNYMMLNLSGHRNDIHKLNPKVLDFGWPDPLSPPLERLCSICKSIDSWLNSDPRNVAVLHCHGGKGRLAVVIAAYMNYTSICASADSALDRFAMKRFYDDKLCDTTQPSQSRYVHYFAGLLSGAIKINSNPLYLHHMLMNGVPNFDGKGGCRPFIKVYQGMEPVFVSPVYTVPDGSRQLCISLDRRLALRGDVLIKCYHKRARTASRELIFRVQFHTCTVSDNRLAFVKQELDEACGDPRFPESGRVEFLFTPDPHTVRDPSSVSVAQPVETSSGGLEHWDSYENFNNLIHDFTAEEPSAAPVAGRVRVMHVQHTEGPLDGSLYATVGKQQREQKEVRQEHHHHYTSTKTSSQHHSTQLTNGGYRQQQQPGFLSNGPLLDHSTDSGISSPLGYTGSGQPPLTKTGSSLQSSSFHATNTSNPTDMLTTQQHPMSTNRLGGPSPKLSSSVKPSYDDQSQLDDILSELLGEQALNDRAGVAATTNKSLSPTQGSLTTQSGNSRTVVSWETSNAGPFKTATVTKHTVGKPAPNAHTETTQSLHKEEYAYSSTMPSQKGSSVSSGSSPTKLPPNAFSYGGVQEARQEARRIHETHSAIRTEGIRSDGVKSPTPPPRDSSKGRVTSPLFNSSSNSAFREHRTVSPTVKHRVPSPVFDTSAQPSKFTSVPYRVDYDNEASRGYYSDSEHSLSWLQQQQVKLAARREGRGSDARSRQEKQLVHELRNAQSGLQRRRAESESQERDVVDQYTKQDSDLFTLNSALMNGQPYGMKTSPDETKRPLGKLQRSASAADSSEYKAEQKYYVTGVERPPFTTHQTKYTFSVSPPKNSDSLRNKPPPAPFGRSAPTSPIIPQKTMSQQQQQNRSKSVTKEWQSQGRQHHHPIATLPRAARSNSPQHRHAAASPNSPPSLARIGSYTLHRTPSNTLPRSCTQSPHATSNRSRSSSPKPMYSAQTIEYKSPRSRSGGSLSRSATLPRNFRQSYSSKFQPIRIGDDSIEEVEHHHEEIIVRRPMLETTVAYNSKLDELEKSLQTALESTPRYEERQPPQVNKESHFTESSFESRVHTTQRSMSPEWDRTVTHLEQLAPPTPAPEATEEEVISLQPIGPGLQNLEPDGAVSSSGTLGRPVRTPTPSFPIQVVLTPPSPSTPNAPELQLDEPAHLQQSSNPPQNRAFASVSESQPLRSVDSVERLIESHMITKQPVSPANRRAAVAPAPLYQQEPLLGFKEEPLSQSTPVPKTPRFPTDPTYATINVPDIVSSPPPPHITRSVEQVETMRTYNHPPQMEPQAPPPPPHPMQTGVTETRFERQEMHGIQGPPPQMMPVQPQPVVAQEHMNRQYESNTLQHSGTSHQMQPQRSPSAQGYSTIDRNRQMTATLDRNASHGLSDTVSPFPDTDHSFEGRTLERSRTLPAQSFAKSSSQTQLHGAMQTMEPQTHTAERSYTTNTSASQQFNGGQQQPVTPQPQRHPQHQGGTQTIERSYTTVTQQQQQQQNQAPMPSTNQIQGGTQTIDRSYSTGSAQQFHGSQQPQNFGSNQIQNGNQTIDRSYSTLSAGQQFNHQQAAQPVPMMQAGTSQTVERSYSSSQHGGPQTMDRSISGGSAGMYQQEGFNQTGGMQMHSGGGQTMDRSYSSSSGQQYSPQYVPGTPPPFPVSPTEPKTPYDNRGGAMLLGQGQMTQEGQSHMMSSSQSGQSHMTSSSQSGQTGMVQNQMQYMQNSDGPGGSTNTITRQHSVTPGGTQIVREYHETVHREYTPGAPISQEERNRMQNEFSTTSQHLTSSSGGTQMGTLMIDTNTAALGHQYSPGNLSSEAGVSPHLHSMTSSQQQQSSQATLRSQVSGGRITPGAQSMTGQSSPGYMGHSRKGSFSSMDGPTELTPHTPRFVRDTSKVWYKPHISRDEAIALLKDKHAGMFVVRDSNSFPGAFGLAVKVAQVPPNVQSKGGDPTAELVRHFLIEPTSKGVKLKGCSNEPVFASLAALVYQHSITPLALPCKLLLPEHEGVDVPDSASPQSTTQLLAHGAACNVLYLYSADMESLTGPEAVAKATKAALSNLPMSQKTTMVHFKVSAQGITLTDNKRRLFFRRHYPVSSVTFCGMDPEDRKWTRNHDDTGLPMNAKIFGFVAKKSSGSLENQCHLFAEIDTEQPATAIVNFVTKVMIGQGRVMKT